MKFTNLMAVEFFWDFSRNGGANKKIRQHQLVKEYRNEGNY